VFGKSVQPACIRRSPTSSIDEPHFEVGITFGMHLDQVNKVPQYVLHVDLLGVEETESSSVTQGDHLSEGAAGVLSGAIV
jgi:hypothetical protein